MDSISRISAKDSLRSYYSEDFSITDSPPPPVKGDASRYKQQDKKVKEQTQDQSDAVPKYTLSLTTITESENLAFGSKAKALTEVGIDAADRTKMVKTVTQIDFVVVIDHSASMKMNNKLAFVQATIEYLISKLTEAHRFCLIKFNQDVSLVTNGLLTMTNDNKEKVRALLHGILSTRSVCADPEDIKPQGTTNISDALFTAIGILANRNHEEQSRISSIMLFTDGLSNAGLRGKGFMDAMKDMIIPAGLTINTFGYGLDHDSKMLQNISFASKGGVYYYIESSKSIPATFGECLAGILSTVSHNIEVRLVAHDGCRIVNFYTKFPIKELKSVKEYGISIGSMYSQECRTVLFKLSLRKMDQEIARQPLVQVIISYTNTLTGVDHKTESSIVVGRPAVVPPQKIPIELDKQINRYTAAAAIEEAIKKASTRDFHGAQSQLKEVIDIVQTSASAKDPSSRVYCEDLVEDLRECSVGMENMESFSSGIHYAHAYSTMYYILMLRLNTWLTIITYGAVDWFYKSYGCQEIGGIHPARTAADHPRNGGGSEEEKETESWVSLRNCVLLAYTHRYGYVTYEQEEEASQAVKQTAIFVTGYLDNALM